jgi:putative transcriptional regulator
MIIKVSGYLSGHLLVALPGDDTSELTDSVIFLCRHDENGAMGLVLNQPLNGLSLSDVVRQMSEGEVFMDIPVRDYPIFWGGPLESHRGFILHSSEASFEHSVPVDDTYGVTGDWDSLRHLISGKIQCENSLILLGCMAWRAGELEREIAQQIWLPIPATVDLVFNVCPTKKWQSAVGQLGLGPATYSPIEGVA